jgi:hypothetical protein
MTEAGITETTGHAGLRRVLLALGLGGALACLAWIAFWLAMHL